MFIRRPPANLALGAWANGQRPYLKKSKLVHHKARETPKMNRMNPTATFNKAGWTLKNNEALNKVLHLPIPHHTDVTMVQLL